MATGKQRGVRQFILLLFLFLSVGGPAFAQDENSGLGLAEQAARLMDPGPTRKEENVAEERELWQEKAHRLARRGSWYELPEAYKKAVLKKQIATKKTISLNQ